MHCHVEFPNETHLCEGMWETLQSGFCLEGFGESRSWTRCDILSEV